MKSFARFAAVLTLAVLTSTDVPAQTPATAQVMRAKLVHSQRVLEAIMTSDFALLERESAELARATQSPSWSVFKSAEYARHTAAFLRATQDLGDAAKGHDLDAAALHYMSLTLSCFQCHRYMKGARIANR